ncbi:MAG: MMPL family transporter, partial [Chloroflexota bacterium]|nr:MMPL family transporter [Chloroflexota bacterium]
MNGLSDALAAVAGRRAKWVVIALWLVAAAVLIPFSGRFESAQDNDQAAFLPADSQSIRAVELAERFAQEEEQAAIVVFRRESGLTPEDRAAVEAAQGRILGAGIEGVVPAPVPPQPSEDGRALLLFVPIAVGDDFELVTESVGQVREIVGEAEGTGLEVAVTGPAGFAADVSEVFAGVDGLLLGATAAIVAVLLLLTYRSPFLWLVPLGVVAFAEIATRGLGYWLAQAGLSISGYTGGLLVVLVFGAGTDYALLLTSRYREELRRYEDKHVAMREALRRAGPTILASAGTVAAALLCLSVAELGSNRGLGPIAAVGIGLALLAMVTLLPAVLLVLGRRVFWPFVPRAGTTERTESPLFA